MRLLHRFLACLADRPALRAGVLAAATVLPLAGAHAADPAAASCPPAAQQLTTETLNAGIRDAKDHGFLWRITKGGRSSYLYGTIHAARAEWMFPGPVTLDALRNSDTLALELDVLDPDILAGLAASARARPDEALPPALQERIDQRMVAECIDPAPWRTYAPEFQIASLAVIAARREGFDPAYAIDVVLALVARQLAKPVVSLETPEGQMAALRLPSRAATIEFVERSLDDLDRDGAGPMITRLVRAWTEGDLADLSDYGRWCECLRNDGERDHLRAAVDALHLRLMARAADVNP